MGDVLKEVAKSTPERQYTVLCGHTHHDGDAKVLLNLHVHAGYSRYDTLDIESMIDIGTDGFSVPRIQTDSEATNPWSVRLHLFQTNPVKSIVSIVSL